MKKIYYRPNQSDAEMLTPQEWRRLIKTWGIQPYNQMEELEFNESFNTSLPIVREVLAYIQNDRKLNEEEALLIERIKNQGFKRSSGYYPYKGDSRTVEAGMLCKITKRAIDLYNKEAEEKFDFYKFPMKEMYRIYSIPFVSIMDKVKESEEKITKLEKPKDIHKINFKYPFSKNGDQQSSYKMYYIKGKLTTSLFYDEKKEKIYKKFPFIGKLHQVISKDYFQLYVYDYHKSNRAMRTVINYLVENELVELQ